jgi:hypothetical protein
MNLHKCRMVRKVELLGATAILRHAAKTTYTRKLSVGSVELTTPSGRPTFGILADF